MARRPIMPLTDKLMGNLLVPRAPKGVPAVGSLAPDFTLPFARYRENPAGKSSVEYGEQLQLSSLRGKRVVLSLTRIVSDRFF